jgi:hypothetical protein
MLDHGTEPTKKNNDGSELAREYGLSWLLIRSDIFTGLIETYQTRESGWMTFSGRYPNRCCWES